MRKALFRIGLITAIVGLVAVMACLFLRFPMVPDYHGHYTVDPRRNLMMAIAFFSASLTVVLALFGRGVRRILLALGGLALLGLWYWASMMTF